MDLTDIIKNAFVFPSKNLETLSIYAVLTLLSGVFIIQGIITCIFGIVDIINLVIGIVYIIISLIIGLITRRISIQCIKSGIELEEKLPDFNWWQSFGTGFSKIIITIYYFIIPALLVVFVGLITNIFGNVMYFIQEVSSQAPNIIMGASVSVKEVIYNAAFPLIISLAITLSIGLIIFLVFSFFQAMAEARLAHTGSLKKALNIYGSAKDISRIGVGKVVLLSIIIFIISTIIETVFAVISNQWIFLSILNIIVTPYIALFAQRALGLLYSDIV